MLSDRNGYESFTPGSYLVGPEDCSAGWWSVFSENYVIEGNNEYPFGFIFTNSTNGQNNWNNWLLVATNGVPLGGAGYAEYFVLLNSDVETPQGWCEPLVAALDADPRLGAVQPKMRSWLRPDYFEYAGACGGFLDRLGYPFCRGRILKKVEKDYGQYDSPSPVFWASGACMMVRSGLYRKLGGLDERFFAHQEEIDFCWRAQLAGYRIVTVPESTVWHVGGGTLPNSSPWKLYLNFRNNLLMLQNNLAKTYALGLYKNSHDPAKAAVEGILKAGQTIRRRMILDGCAAVVYLVSFRFRYFSAVLKAHRDFRKAGRRPDMEDTAKFVSENAGKVTVYGLYRKWMVPRAIAGMKIELEEYEPAPEGGRQNP